MIKKSLAIAMALSTVFVLPEPVVAQQREAGTNIGTGTGSGVTRPLNIAEEAILCATQNSSSTTSLTQDQVQDGFRATGYISTLVCHQGTNSNAKALAGSYTRWLVEPAAVILNDGQRVYSLEGRGWLSRLFSDRVIETSHSLEIAMAAPTVNFTIPLATFKYNEEGENGVEYTTNLRNHAFNQTYFRVEPNTTMNITARGQHSFRTSYTGAVEVLSAVQDVVKLVAPSSTLLTSVNAEQLTTTSNAINSIASSLFDKSYDETVSDGFGVESWYDDRRVLVLVQLPFEITSHERNRSSANSDTPIYLSYWLSLACPRRSMFNPQDECGVGNAATPTTGSILAFEMASNKTVQQFLSDQQWYKDFLASDVFRAPSAGQNNAQTQARNASLLRFCRSIANGVYGAGFNDVDTRLIVAAAIDGMPELSPISTSLRSACDTTENDRSQGELGLRSFRAVEP